MEESGPAPRSASARSSRRRRVGILRICMRGNIALRAEIVLSADGWRTRAGSGSRSEDQTYGAGIQGAGRSPDAVPDVDFIDSITGMTACSE